MPRQHKIMAIFWAAFAALFFFVLVAPAWASSVVFIVGALLMSLYEWRKWRKARDDA